MFVFDDVPLPKLGLTGLEGMMSEEELAIQEVAHRFAEEVMRPIGEKMDKLTAEQAVAEDSPVWEFYQKLDESGIFDLEAIGGMSNEEKARILPIILEEFAWGDAGLTLLSMVTHFAAITAVSTGKSELIERFAHLRGCWIGTQPDRGSDVLDIDKTESIPGSKHGRGNLIARVDGDELVISGQTSAWVSGAPLAECGLMYTQCDYGDGIYREDGGLHYVGVLVPFDLPGFSRGLPLEKLGLRSLPQGELYFDEVRVPMSYVIAGKDTAYPSFFGSLTFGNMEMSVTYTGIARAAYEHALDYVHERKQGGGVIINHQSVRVRLFDMFRNVEACRAMAHRAFNYNYGPNGPHLLGSATAKTFVTKTSVDVTSEALQMFGGNGLTKEYPLEKLFRDARAGLITDGENNVLSLKGGTMLSNIFKDKHGLT